MRSSRRLFPTLATVFSVGLFLAFPVRLHFHGWDLLGGAVGCAAFGTAAAMIVAGYFYSGE